MGWSRSQSLFPSPKWPNAHINSSWSPPTPKLPAELLVCSSGQRTHKQAIGQENQSGKKQTRNPRHPAMASQSIEDHRSGAEVHTGHELCGVKARELLVELGLPNGLLPLPSLQEVGYNRATGFVWLRQSQSGGVTHTFDAIGKQVWYAGEVTALVERGRMHSLTGVKSKELLIWVTISEIVVSPSGSKIVFRTPAGLGRAFPVSAFQLNPPAPDGEAKAAEEGAAATN